mmetsp:Transcript_22713/g.37906  ORF Transcript_22713/g.37906 Transcript_22713/m.37906 type:complete len:202 (-) Transcript_22713:59-664(-)
MLSRMGCMTAGWRSCSSLTAPTSFFVLRGTRVLTSRMCSGGGRATSWNRSSARRENCTRPPKQLVVLSRPEGCPWSSISDAYAQSLITSNNSFAGVTSVAVLTPFPILLLLLLLLSLLPPLLPSSTLAAFTLQEFIMSSSRLHLLGWHNACSLKHDAATATETEAEDPSPAPMGKPFDCILMHIPTVSSDQTTLPSKLATK